MIKNYLRIGCLALAMGLLVVSMSSCRSSKESRKDKVAIVDEVSEEEAAEEARAKAESDAAAQAMMEKETGKKAKRNGKKKDSVSEKKESAKDRSTVAVVVADDSDFQSDEERRLIKYKVWGKALDEKGKPIVGLQIVLSNGQVDATPKDLRLWNETTREYVEMASDTTKIDGSFEITLTDVEADYMRLFVRDVDGPMHGNYTNDVMNLEFGEQDLEDSGHGWRPRMMVKELTLRPKLRR